LDSITCINETLPKIKLLTGDVTQEVPSYSSVAVKGGALPPKNKPAV
jgi:hypothetical protein